MVDVFGVDELKVNIEIMLAVLYPISDMIGLESGFFYWSYKKAPNCLKFGVRSWKRL
ncbi:hypothetical protein LOSG293_060060 [Secundilactobacillus oryzae JCM 18671]|uniref:Uncharacterized protein n=1 Tax=Secundilactobacillus oryzae JCM 18671 TaxID=1291743 RepID=A0A081BH84_9LACO|nr:hypothetical protein LOSG293_060060 [Secundilactobacillus oryzae JCM 18671]